MRNSKAAFAHAFCDGHHKKAFYNLWLQIFFEPAGRGRCFENLSLPMPNFRPKGMREFEGGSLK